MRKEKSIMRRWVRAAVLAVLFVLLLAVPLLAGYTQYIPLNLSENNTSSSAMASVIVPVNNAYLYANGYISSSLNTSVQGNSGSLPWMLSANKTNYAQPIVQGASYVNQYALNNSPAANATSIIVGNGGYLTIADNTTLEPGNNFSIEANGWIDTSSGASKYISNKSGAFTLDAGSIAAGNITTTVSNTTSGKCLPIGVGANTSITSVNPAEAHWLAVSDSSDVSYIYNSSASEQDDLYTTSFSSVPSNVLINSVTVYIRLRRPTPTAAYGYPLLYLNSTLSKGALQAGDAAYATLGSVVARPGGGNWALADLSTLQIGVGLYSSGTDESDCSEVYATVDYTPQLSIAATSTNRTIGVSLVPNYLTNSSFEVGNPPTGWGDSGAGLSQSNTFAYIGSYSAKIVAPGLEWASQTLSLPAGTNITGGMQIKTTDANTAFVNLWNGVTDVGSSYCPADGSWHWITVTTTIVAGSAPQFQARMSGAGTAYFDGAIWSDASLPNQYYNYNLLLNTAIVASAALDGNFTATDNNNPWLIDQNNAMPYMTYYKQSVNGAEVLKYQPKVIVGDVGYSTGTISGASNTTVLTGNGTSWADAMTFDLVKITGDSTYYTVTRVVSADTAWITPALTTSPSGASYNFYSAIPNDDTNKACYGAITWGNNPADLVVSTSPMVMVPPAASASTAPNIPNIIKGITGSTGPSPSPVNPNFPLYGLFAMAGMMLNVSTLVMINVGAIFLIVGFGAMCLVSRLGPLFTGVIMVAIGVILNVMHIFDYWMVFMLISFIFLSWVLPKQTAIL